MRETLAICALPDEVLVRILVGLVSSECTLFGDPCPDAILRVALLCRVSPGIRQLAGSANVFAGLRIRIQRETLNSLAIHWKSCDELIPPMVQNLACCRVLELPAHPQRVAIANRLCKAWRGLDSKVVMCPSVGDWLPLFYMGPCAIPVGETISLRMFEPR
jgi:hypothetical protein